MISPAEKFRQLLYLRLIPDFCGDGSRGFEPEAFDHSSLKLTDRDAEDFLRAWELGVLLHQGRGLYSTPMGGAREQFFWSGPKSHEVRRFRLSLEPIITVAAFARLHHDHHWPLNLLGCQSTDYAFDLVAYSSDGQRETIACEVKKTTNEVADLIRRMSEIGAKWSEASEPRSGPARNAFKKLSALNARKAPIFWIVGPSGRNHVFQTVYEDPAIRFIEVDERFLNFDKWPDQFDRHERSASKVHQQPEATRDQPFMKFAQFSERINCRPIIGSDGSHTARLRRAALNIECHARRDSSDDRLLHLMSRVGILCEGLARDLRSGHTSAEDVATILEQMADLGKLSFDAWMS